MSEEEVMRSVHPAGEEPLLEKSEAKANPTVDTFAGKVHIKWLPEGAVSSLGLMPYFIEFLKTSGRFEQWVSDCPLSFVSPNAPQKRDVLGTLLLSVISGHWRYAHISAIRGDGVNPRLLGMKKVVSEDSARRAIAAIAEEAGENWMKRQLKASYEPLLEEPWIMDMDSTVKPLYGHQEDAKVGYNPKRQGRPSHVYHTDFIAALRIIVDVEVQAGNQTATLNAQPGLWALLDGLEASKRPVMLRGDCHWGTESAMAGAEQRNIGYIFKLIQTGKVKKLIARLFHQERWVDAGQQWEGVEDELQLQGWTKKRRVVVLRRPLRSNRVEKGHAKIDRKIGQQLTLELPRLNHSGVIYEYAVLVTAMPEPIPMIAQHYRDRGDSENNFDELKNQWAWAGFTTQDRKRCQIMARITAMIYNWWTIFMRLGTPDKHSEAITSRPLALHGIARQTQHSNQTTLEITSMHTHADLIAKALTQVSGFLQRIKTIAEQLTPDWRWRLILSAAFRCFLAGRILGTTGRLAESTG